jgi:hypothetical protein
MSGTGKDYLHSVNEALRNYEDAIIQREKFRPLERGVRSHRGGKDIPLTAKPGRAPDSAGVPFPS